MKRKAILLGSQLCEQVENIVKFVVTEDISGSSDSSSVGAQLSAQCIKYSTVAQGFLMWAKTRASNSEFASSVAYQYTAPGILSLARIISIRHPLLRECVMDVAILFVKHSNSELSYQKLNAIKEQALRLLLIVASKGLVIEVFNIVASQLSSFDSGLIRYFVSGALSIMRPPYSLSLVRSFGQLLLNKSCIDALNAVYFESNKKQALAKLVACFKETVLEEKSNFSRSANHDRSITLALASAYSF